MTALVTGAAGFIGSALVRMLIRHGEEVVGVDAMSYASSRERLAELDEPVVLVESDVSDREAMAALVADIRPRVIYHLAAESHVDRSIEGPMVFVRANVVGTVALLQVASEADLGPTFRFIHVSTDEVYGSLGDSGRFQVDSAYDPRSPYAASKAGSDHFARAWFHTYGLPVIVTNCSNNYGPFQFPEKLIPVTILRALAGEPIQVYGTGGNVRDWLHVDDHCRALRRVARSGVPGSTYLIGGGAEVTNLELVRTLCRHLDRKRPSVAGRSYESQIQLVDDRPGHDWRYSVDTSLIRSELEWEPQVEFAAGIESVVDWYLDNQDWWLPLVQDRYDGRRLGLGGTA